MGCSITALNAIPTLQTHIHTPALYTLMFADLTSGYNLKHLALSKAQGVTMN